MRVTSIENGTFTENYFHCCICPYYFSDFHTFYIAITSSNLTASIVYIILFIATKLNVLCSCFTVYFSSPT